MARFTVRPFSVIFQPPLEKLKALAGTAIDGQPSHFLEHREQAPRRVGLACTLRAGFASTAPWLPGGELAPRTSAALDGQGAGRESWAAGGSGFKLGLDCRVRQCDLRAGAVVSVWVAWPSARKRQRSSLAILRSRSFATSILKMSSVKARSLSDHRHGPRRRPLWDRRPSPSPTTASSPAGTTHPRASDRRQNRRRSR